jgi:hypothetical protein
MARTVAMQAQAIARGAFLLSFQDSHKLWHLLVIPLYQNLKVLKTLSGYNIIALLDKHMHLRLNFLKFA